MLCVVGRARSLRFIFRLWFGKLFPQLPNLVSLGTQTVVCSLDLAQPATQHVVVSLQCGVVQLLRLSELHRTLERRVVARRETVRLLAVLPLQRLEEVALVRSFSGEERI